MSGQAPVGRIFATACCGPCCREPISATTGWRDRSGLPSLAATLPAAVRRAIATRLGSKPSRCVLAAALRRQLGLGRPRRRRLGRRSHHPSWRRHIASHRCGGLGRNARAARLPACSSRARCNRRLRWRGTATLRFSTLGIVSVGTLLATGVVNTWYLVGSFAGADRYELRPAPADKNRAVPCHGRDRRGQSASLHAAPPARPQHRERAALRNCAATP